MDPRRKKIYIIIIVVCFALSAGILGWGFLGGSPVPQEPNFHVIDPASNPAGAPVISQPNTMSQIDFTAGLQLPSVFPATNVFNTSVLDSKAFEKLSDYTPLDITGQIGRDNPFQ